MNINEAKEALKNKSKIVMGSGDSFYPHDISFSGRHFTYIDSCRWRTAPIADCEVLQDD